MVGKITPATLVTLFAAASLAAQAPGSVSSVMLGESACLDSLAPRTLAQTYSCVELTVVCPDTLDRPVNLRVTEPPAGTEIRGTLVVGGGGAGRGWYESEKKDPDEIPAFHARDMIDRLNVAGFRVIQRRWGDDPVLPMVGGWIDGSTSLHDSACRYATLLYWIHGREALHNQEGEEAFCAQGQSGGASELAYALSLYGVGDLLDLALLSGGPPHGAPHFGCDNANAAWEAQCNGWLDSPSLGICPHRAGAHNCFYNENAKQVNVNAAFDLNLVPPEAASPCTILDTDVLRNNSVVSPGWIKDYPQTRVHFLYGVLDCGSSPPLSLPFLTGVLNNSTGVVGFDVVAATDHTVPASIPGTLRIEEIVDDEGGCSVP